MILGKFQSGTRPGTWWNRQLKFRCKNIIKECKNKVKTDNFKVFFVYTLCSWIFCVKYKNFVGQWFRSRNKQIFCFWQKILKLWPDWVEISNNVVYKWRKLYFSSFSLFFSLNFIFALLHQNFNCRFDHVPSLAPLWNFPKIISLFL
jgi:hypothetical protein